MRARDWKLLEYHEDGRLELYILARNLAESDHLAQKLPERAADLRQRLNGWRQTVGARMPVPNPDYREGRRPGAAGGSLDEEN